MGKLRLWDSRLAAALFEKLALSENVARMAKRFSSRLLVGSRVSAGVGRETLGSAPPRGR
jgi:hypothetical protein